MKTDLPDNVEQLKAMLRKQQAQLRVYEGQVAGYEREIARLKAQIDKLKRMLFGQSSEKLRIKLGFCAGNLDFSETSNGAGCHINDRLSDNH